jgi:hypothetical protein
LSTIGKKALAWSLWIITFAFAVARGRHMIPYGVYTHAATQWLQREPLYDLTNIDGFQYFPSAAVLFSPLVWLGEPLARLVWLSFGWGCYALALQRSARRLAPSSPDGAFLIASAAAIGPALANLFNGQANLLVAALIMHAELAALDRRCWSAAGLFAIGVALKPLMLVPALLAAAAYTELRIPLTTLAPITLGLPLLVRPDGYAVAQYADCIRKLALCAEPDRLFEDLRGLLVTCGVELSSRAYTLLRTVAALLALAWAVRWRRQTCAIATAYLVLFNPRTLSSSYVMPGGYAALALVDPLQRRQRGRAVFLAAICLAWSINHHVVPQVQYWLRPLAAIMFILVLWERRDV